MLPTAAFAQWCHRLGRGQGRAQNVSGTYASRTRGLTIQFESHKVDWWAMYAMAYNAHVLEYCAHPATRTLPYQSPSGRTVVAAHPPDFLVLRQDSGGLAEWKQAAPRPGCLTLWALSPRPRRPLGQPARCSGSGAAGALLPGALVRRPSAHLHAKFALFRGLLLGASRAPAPAAPILEAVERQPGLSLAALLQTWSHLAVDAVEARRARGGL